MTNIQTDTAHMLLLTSTMYSVQCTFLQLLHILYMKAERTRFMNQPPPLEEKKSSTLVNALAFKSTGFSFLLYISI